MLQRRKQCVLLLGQLARAGFLRIEIAIKLLAAANEMRRRFGEPKLSIAFAPPLTHSFPQ